MANRPDATYRKPANDSKRPILGQFEQPRHTASTCSERSDLLAKPSYHQKAIKRAESEKVK
jgi:hypothetical protein